MIYTVGAIFFAFFVVLWTVSRALSRGLPQTACVILPFGIF